MFLSIPFRLDKSNIYSMVLEYSCMPIVVWQNKVLYTDETVYGTSRISIPKGHIEPGETKLQCAIRECEEETGVKLLASECVHELNEYNYEFKNPYNGNKDTCKTIYPMIFIIKEKRPIKISEKNVNLADYMDIDELIKTLTFDNVREVIKQTKKYLNI